MSAPTTRAARHAIVEELIGAGEVHSQSELQGLLADRGVSVTQTTVSRDLDELRAVKVRGTDGSQVYALPALVSPAPATDATQVHARLERWCVEVLVDADHAQNLAVLRTPPGAAQLLASAVDQSRFPGVLGCVAGDDTVLVITRDDETAAGLVTRLLDLARRGGPRSTSRTETTSPDQGERMDA
ncbi:arginine repressor [Georgenia sp. Z1344]|uniref:arginine repressor n=1 Tax=Georgenia sp. Z1344 TaxID=3416706 RepID=UPI003CF01F0C